MIIGFLISFKTNENHIFAITAPNSHSCIFESFYVIRLYLYHYDKELSCLVILYRNASKKRPLALSNKCLPKIRTFQALFRSITVSTLSIVILKNRKYMSIKKGFVKCTDHLEIINLINTDCYSPTKPGYHYF